MNKKFKTNYLKVQIKHFAVPQRVFLKTDIKEEEKLTVEKVYLIIDRVAMCGLGISQIYYQTFYFCYLLAGFRCQK